MNSFYFYRDILFSIEEQNSLKSILDAVWMAGVVFFSKELKN